MSDSSSPQDKPQMDIVSDDDWKTRVKDEDARMDAQSREEGGDKEEVPVAEGEPEIDPEQIPDASFFTLMQLLSSQAIAALGLIPGPNGKATVQLPIAKHFIDLLSVLETKCSGNLSEEEQQFLEGTLHELRMAYIQVSSRRAPSP